MRLALQEGSKGLGLTTPNPSVGAVIVRDGEVIGQGFHHAAGQPHAEREALADCQARGHDACGAVIYITLEPCSTTGRTPPCTAALLESGLRRAVWAATDPNPAHQGRARMLLEEAGVEVTTGILAEEAAHLHRAFFKVQREALPWVMVKTALSLDGRITRPEGEGQWLTSAEARADVQTLRREADAILTSGSTARADNPRLDYRGEHSVKKQPVRVVVSNQAQAGLAAEAHLLVPRGQELTRFCSGDLRNILSELAQDGLQTVLVEAGGELVGSLLDQGLVDEWISYFAPLVCGGGVPAVGAEGIVALEARPRLRKVSYRQFGPDIRMRGLVVSADSSSSPGV